MDGHDTVAEYLEGKQVWISMITELELYGKKGLTKKEINEIDNLVDNCFVSEINFDVKEHTKSLMQSYGMKLPDAIIAATSFVLDLPLITADEDFRKVSDLKLVLLEI